MRRGATAAAVALVLLAFGAAPAGATPPPKPAACGTITGRVILTGDLTCAEVHVMPRSTVDLGGYRLKATTITVDHATIHDGALSCLSGDVTVTDSRFVHAAIIGQGCGMTVTGNTIAGHFPNYSLPAIGAGGPGVGSIVVTGNRIAGYDNAVDLHPDQASPQDVIVTGNRLTYNTVGLVMGCVSTCLIAGNSISHNELWGIGGGGSDGSTTTIIANRILGNSVNGIRWGVGDVVATGNRVQGNGTPQCLGVVCD